MVCYYPHVVLLLTCYVFRIDLGSPVDKLEHPIYPATDFLAHQKSKAAADNEDVESEYLDSNFFQLFFSWRAIF